MALYDVSTSEKKASPELVAGGTLYSSMPLASLVFFSGDTDKIPTGFCIADGRALSRTTYASLFAILGTTWGSGDGSTTFNIPDLSGKTAMGVETDHDLGASEDGALPNIKSDAQNSMLSWASGSEIKPTSAIYSGGAGYQNGTTVGSSGAWNYIRMDASRSSSIYTDGQTKVDPANVRAYWIIKISEVGVPADFLAVVGETTPWTNTTVSGIRYRKKNGIVFVHFDYSLSSARSTDLNFGAIIPEGFRPNATMDGCVKEGSSNALDSIRVKDDGVVILFVTPSTSSLPATQYKGIISYPVD